MQPVEFPGSKQVPMPENMAKEYINLWGMVGIDAKKRPFILTAWQPSYEDMQALNRGEPIYVKQLGFDLPPVILFTLDEEQNSNDAQAGE